MATYGKKLLDNNNNVILPKTRSSLVYMDDNSTVEDTINKIISGTTVVGKATKLATARNIGNASFDGSGDITLAQMGIPAFPVEYSKNGIIMNSNFTLLSGGYFQFGKMTFINMRVSNKNAVVSNGPVCSGLPKPLRENAGTNVALVCTSEDHVTGVIYQSGETEEGILKLYYMHTDSGNLEAGRTIRLLSFYLSE